MKNKSFGILKPQKEDYCFAYLLSIIAVLSLWIGCGIAIQKSHDLALEALRVCVDALAFRYTLGAEVVLTSLIFYIGMAFAIFMLVMAILKKDHKKYLAFAGTVFASISVAMACAFFASYIFFYVLYGTIILILLLAVIGLNCYNNCEAMIPAFCKQEEAKGVKVEPAQHSQEELDEKPRAKRKYTRKTPSNNIEAKNADKVDLKKGKRTYVKKMFKKKFKDLTPEEKNEYYRVAKRRQKARKKAK